MTTYRTFQNTDPPKILELWNAAGDSRGFGVLAGCDGLEQYLFSKQYFKPNGMHLAFDGPQLIGLCHAGFGASEDQSALDTSVGTVAMLMVHPDYQRQGVGSELLKKGQEYLTENGAQLQYAGCLNPVNPFYFGLYGGSEMPGILESCPSMISFIEKHEYQRADSCFVYNLELGDLPGINDNRVPLLRRQVDVQVEPWPLSPTWWHGSMLGPMVALGYDITERGSNAPIGRAWVWEMEAFSRRLGKPAVGLIDFVIEESRRRKGYGKLLLHSILKHLQSQKIGYVEVQTMERNEAARGLYEGLGFTHADTGHMYRKP